MASISIPLMFSDVTGGARRADVTGSTLREVFAALDSLHPGIQARILTGDRLGPHVTVTIDGKIAGEGLASPVRPDSQISIFPALGGG